MELKQYAIAAGNACTVAFAVGIVGIARGAIPRFTGNAESSNA
jgi:hypothetical protein